MPDALESESSARLPQTTASEADSLATTPYAETPSPHDVPGLLEELQRIRHERDEAQRRYEALYAGSPVGYCTLDAHGRIVAANPRMAALLREDHATLLGGAFADWLAPDDRPGFAAVLATSRNCPCPEALDARLRRRDGSLAYVSLETRPGAGVDDPATGQSGPLLMVRDVTCRREADEAMRLANHILENSPAMLLRYPIRDEEPGPIEYVSANVSRFGFSRDVLLSGTFSPRMLVHPDDLARVESLIRRNATLGRDAFGLDYRLRTPQGHVRHVTDRVQIRRDASGTVNAIQGLILDVTDSVMIRTDLETVLDSAPIPIVKIRLVEDGNRILDYQNPAAERLFGSDAVGKSCKQILCHKEACPVLGAPSGMVREQECAIMTQAGRRIMYKTARKLPDAPCIIEAMVDVTELMRTRERLTRAMEAAEAANSAKSQFLATMSHEIRTPMNGIMGMTELALDTELTGEQREYLDLAHQSAVSLLEIINDILDFSRIETGRMELSSAPFTLRQSLDSSLRLLRPLAKRQHNTVELAIAPDVPEVLVGDAGRLAQVVVNLVSNGLKFTRDGSVKVTVDTTPVVQCPLDRDPELACTLLFAVADTGIGIPRDKQQRIFEYFTQLDASLNRGAGGTGLGLSISKNLVSLMGGRLWLESEPQQGSTFFFTATFTRIARPQSGREEVPETPCPSSTARSLSLLLVEDNCINQLVAKRLLERRGHRVDAVDNGLSALERLAKGRYDAVLMDVEMPGLTGLETLERLRDAATYGEAAATPVIALTAHATNGFREKMLARGFDGYVSKPIDLQKLDDALAQLATRA